MNSAEAAKAVEGRFNTAPAKEFRGDFSISVSPEALHDVCAYCRDGLGFDYLVDVTGIDHLGDESRFEIAYELVSLSSGAHLRLKTHLPEDEPAAPTVADLWPTADWHEREIFDLMGIRFDGHPDLRRIIMWEGYPHHPLRKDFPLEGKPTEVPDVAFTSTAPLAGGPFVTAPTDGTTQVREPRPRRAGDLPPAHNFIAEP